MVQEKHFSYLNEISDLQGKEVIHKRERLN